jgi:hypothetical protein
MTDRRPDRDETRLSDELATWFAGEIRQAELDLRRAPLRPARGRRGPARGIAAPAAAAILVVVLVIAGISRLPSLAGPATEPTGSASPVASPTASQPAATPSPEPASSIDSRYADGIPAVIDGERVVRPSTIERLGPGDDRSFLLGGWLFDYRGIVVSCGLQVAPPPSFGPRCMTPYITDAPHDGSGGRIFVEDWVLQSGGGPVVFRVHRHDARAVSCVAERREACEATAVYEATVWAGDDVTAAGPLKPMAVVSALSFADPRLSEATLTPVGRLPQGPSVEPTSAVPSPGGGPDRCAPPFPPMTWSVVGSGLSLVLVFPSVAAREAVESKFNASGFEGIGGCWVITDSYFNHEWVAVANVMVAVQVNVDGPTAAQAKLVEDVREALERP